MIDVFFPLQITVYFRNRLYRGNRVTKIDCDGLSAFDSCNFPLLAEFRTKIQGKDHQGGNFDCLKGLFSEMGFNI